MVKNDEIWEPVFSLPLVDSQNFLVTFIRGCHFSDILIHVLVNIMFLEICYMSLLTKIRTANKW